jgi:hypothetical protein
MGGGPDRVEKVEEYEWGLFIDFSGSGDSTSTSPESRRLREDWAGNRFILGFIAGAGWLGRGPKKKGPLWRRVGGVVPDPYGVLKAEYEATVAAIRAQFDRLMDRPGASLADLIRQESAAEDAALREYEEKRHALDDHYRAQVIEGLEAEVAEQRRQVEQMEQQQADLQAELRKLETTDARTESEKAANEPAHPAYYKVHQAEQRLLRVQVDIELEKRLLKAREDDLARLRAGD